MLPLGTLSLQFSYSSFKWRDLRLSWQYLLCVLCAWLCTVLSNARFMTIKRCVPSRQQNGLFTYTRQPFFPGGSNQLSRCHLQFFSLRVIRLSGRKSFFKGVRHTHTHPEWHVMLLDFIGEHMCVNSLVCDHRRVQPMMVVVLVCDHRRVQPMMVVVFSV